MSDKIISSAIFKVRPGMEVIAKQELLEFAKASLEQEGCEEYHVFQSIDKPGTFRVQGLWANEKLFVEHIKSEIVQGYAAKGKEMLAEPFEVQRWKTLS